MNERESNTNPFEVDPDHRTRGDELLEQFRQQAVFTDQFRMGTVFLLTFVAALIALLPRVFGAKPVNFFTAMGLFACALGPLTTLVVNGFFPVFSKRIRRYLSGGLLSLLAFGWFVLLTYTEGSIDYLLALVFLAVLWSVQAFVMWMLWNSLFANNRTKQ